MKKIPREIKRKIKELQQNGADVYLIGKSLECVILENGIEKWEFVVCVELGDKKKKTTVVEQEFVIKQYEGSIDAYLDSRVFTVDAVAFDGETWINPYHGFEDFEAERLVMLHEPKEVFMNEPEVMMEVVKKVAISGFTAESLLKEAIRECAHLLGKADKTVITNLFSDIMTGKYTGKALHLMDESGLLAELVGNRLYRMRNKKEKAAFKKYIQHIDETLPILDRRIVSFFLGFWKSSDMKAMQNLNFDDSLKKKMEFVHAHLSDLYYIHKSVDLKDYLYKYGLERYTFIDNISKIQARVYELDKSAIAVRYRLFQNIAAQNEPVFLEDLAMNQELLLEENLAEDEKSALQILDYLVYIVHRHPEYNVPKTLLSQAYRLNKNPLRRAYFRYCSRKL